MSINVSTYDQAATCALELSRVSTGQVDRLSTQWRSRPITKTHLQTRARSSTGCAHVVPTSASSRLVRLFNKPGRSFSDVGSLSDAINKVIAQRFHIKRMSGLYEMDEAYPLTAQASRHSQLLSPSAERNRTQLYAVVNPKDYRMSTGGGINPNNNNGQNTPSSTTAVATTLFPRCPSQIQQAPPRVHFRDTKGRPRFRHPSESTSVRAPPPFVRSFSSKAFEISDGLPPPPSVPRPSSPQHELAYRHRDTLLDKGIQCEPEAGITQQTKTHSNPLLSALLAAANATVNCPLGSSELDPALRRKPQFRAGTLPYWSDSEVNAYDSLDAFNAAPQNCLGMVGGSKAYPSASVVAAAATAAAMALAAVQSTSRGPTAKSLEPPMGTPMSRASLHLEDLTSEAAIMRSLTGQFADTSLYPRFPTSVDQRKSVNFDATSLQKPDIYGNAGPYNFPQIANYVLIVFLQLAIQCICKQAIR
ncbi:hypothetical protein EGR_02397 [Echinococcus granulosus]|uniref:Uncharacterized protein n=1 Tax=Echinococcus granulosus TaxID=6210 RepID=W6UPA7_ECHGR|nr:hypothetical protein EGR_02397 [Echinococcus granulosus]EUB62601.1 hypothetical protein EGR_02397 [Echinococcus granulosus]